MTHTRSHRKLAVVLAAALGLIALLALPSFAAAKAKDRNHDGIPDRWEKRFHLSLRVDQAHRNQDHEGLDNLEEFEHGTNPRAADTDHDGLTDSQEVEVGDNPRRADSNGDGIPDGQENAGKVATFDGTNLTIELFAGGTLSGQVNESTELECEHHEGEASASDSSGEEEQAGEDSGEGGEEAEAADEADSSPECTTADLVPGAFVKEAELDATPEGAVFHSVHLAG